MNQPSTPREAADDSPGGDGVLAPLVDLIRRLRAPDGCPWDRAQEIADVRAYLVEETHEVASAIDHLALGDDPVAGAENLLEELGDLLFQICFLVELADEKELFGLEAVVEGVCRKMIDRHPHVFADEVLDSAEEVARAWERRKAEGSHRSSLLESVPDSLPALVGAYRIGQKAAGLGFDWDSPEAVLAKVEEEIEEIREASAEGERAKIEEEIGDLLLTVASLARHHGVDPERALAGANLKFRRRFRRVEESLTDGDERTPEALDRLWRAAKEHR